MALQKITDAAGREAYYDPSADRVFTEGGTRDTYYNLADWNARQLKKYGSGSSSGSGYSSGGGGSISQEFSQIYKDLSGMFGNSGLYESLIGTGKDIKSAAESAAQAYKDQIPAVQNIYAKLAEELKMQMEKETAGVEQSKTEDLAMKAEEAARSGFETGTGYEAAMRRNLAAKYDDRIAAVADEWQIDRERLASEEIKDIKTLEAEAAQALMTGNMAVADINAQIIGLKNQEAQLISAAAANIMETQDRREKMYYDRLYNDALLDLKTRELDLQAQKLALDASSGSAGSDLKTVEMGGQGFVFDPNTGALYPVEGTTDRATQFSQAVSATNQLIREGALSAESAEAQLITEFPDFGEDIRGLYTTKQFDKPGGIFAGDWKPGADMTYYDYLQRQKGE